MKRVLLAASLALGLGVVSTGLLATAASASPLLNGQPPTASCTGVVVNLVGFIASPTSDTNTITLEVGSASSTQTFTTSSATITFPWSSVGVNTAGGGAITYSLVWVDTSNVTGTLGPYSFNATSCVESPSSTAAPTTSSPSTTTTLAAGLQSVGTTPPAGAAAATVTTSPKSTTTTTAPKTVTVAASKPVVSASTASKSVSTGLATPVAGATTVHTGEPWAGTGPLVAAVIALGVMMLGLGEVLRRKRRSSSL